MNIDSRPVMIVASLGVTTSTPSEMKRGSLGIDEPPLAVVLDSAEEARGRLPGTVAPAAEPIAVRRRGMCLEVGSLELVPVHHVGFGLNLSRPVDPGILPERIDDPVERQGRQPAGRIGFPGCGWPGRCRKELERHNMAEDRTVPGPRRSGAAAGIRGGPRMPWAIGSTLQRHRQDSGLAGLEPGLGCPAVGVAIGRDIIVDPDAELDLVLFRVLHRQQQEPVRVPVPGRPLGAARFTLAIPRVGR